MVGVSDRLEERAENLRESLRHRGPDDSGIWYARDAGMALVHTRLAILDLSPAGHQPMQTDDGRLTIVFNGEIYNFKELRAELVQAGISLKSHSDTEVLLHLYARHGTAMVDHLAGMFAFAIWDRQTNKLVMARDPLGIKPLYYWKCGHSLAFASEMRALLGTQLSTACLDADALQRFLMMGSVQEPDTLVSGVFQVPAGHLAEFHNGELKLVCFWKPNYQSSLSDPQAAIKLTREALVDSIKRHYVSDVPVGMFLSGGIDSTAVVALAKATGQSSLTTFCISFDNPKYNEGQVAERTARHFGTEHYDWRMTEDEGQELVEDFLRSSDLPSNDGFNTYCVSRLARKQGLKVVLSGLGGDELFGGYPSFSRVPDWVNKHRKWQAVRGVAASILSHSGSIGLVAPPKAARIAEFLNSPGSFSAAYWMTRAFFTPSEAAQIVVDLTGRQPTMRDGGLFRDPDELPGNGNEVSFLEITRYMRNQLLRDSDVMSMAHGLELRVPLVDRHLYDSVNQIPSRLRLQKNKQMLLDAVPEVPEWVWNRPKQGFRFPFEDWVNNRWKERFTDIQQATRIPLGAWYRKWLIFALSHFTRSCAITTEAC